MTLFLCGALALQLSQWATSSQATAPAPAPVTTAAAAGPTTIYFVRHAETVVGEGGRSLDEFTPAGEAQAEALPARLDALAPHFDVILVSPAHRAIATVLPYLQQKLQVAEIVPELTESSWSASDPADRPVANGPVQLSDDERRWFHLPGAADGALLSPGIVPRAAGSKAGAALVAFDDALLRRRYSGRGLKVLVVGHFHTGARLLQALQGGGVPPYDPAHPPYSPANGAISVLRQDCTGTDYVLLRYNDADTGHSSRCGADAPH